jgi:hypothetical protein
MAMISPSKFISLAKLREIQGDYYRALNGNEYCPEEVDDLILAKQSDEEKQDKQFMDWLNQGDPDMEKRMKQLYLVETAFGAKRITFTPTTGSYPDKILRQANVDADCIFRTQIDRDDCVKTQVELTAMVSNISATETTEIEKCFEALADLYVYSREYTLNFIESGVRQYVRWTLEKKD